MKKERMSFKYKFPVRTSRKQKLELTEAVIASFWRKIISKNSKIGFWGDHFRTLSPDILWFMYYKSMTCVVQLRERLISERIAHEK